MMAESGPPYKRPRIQKGEGGGADREEGVAEREEGEEEEEEGEEEEGGGGGTTAGVKGGGAGVALEVMSVSPKLFSF